MVLTFTDNDRFHRWAAVVAMHGQVPGARVLSSGCGFGGSLLAWRDAGAAVAVGVEVEPDYLRLSALRTADLAGAGVVSYDGARLPFADATFDIVESMDVIEHTPDPLVYLRELRRVLAPSGVILLVTPNRLWPVEQHLGIAGPPWLPVRTADALFGGLSRLPGLSDDRRFRYAKLRGMRTQNLSLRSLRSLAKSTGLFLQLLRAEDHDATWPLPPPAPWAARLLDDRIGKFVSPVTTLAVLLRA